MKHVKIEVVIPGMITAEDIIGHGKQLILPKGLVLTDKAIHRLETYNIHDIRIEDPIGIVVEEIDDSEPAIIPTLGVEDFVLIDSADSILSALSGIDLSAAVSSEPSVVVKQQEEPSHFEKVQASKEFHAFKETFESNVSDLKCSINDIVEKNAPIEVDHMIDSTLQLINSQANSFGVFDMLHNMRQFDDLTYAHSMNVALICNVFSEWLGFTKEESKLATACGMLHDIGKLKIADSIIKKPNKLTEKEYRIIQSHPIEGYKILQHQDISEHIKNSALMHHEKCDGSGYPLHLPSEKIDSYAKLVAIADVYDAMTSKRVYRGALCPFKVIELFENEGLHKYDIVYIMTFLENVINTYIDNRVLLSDGRIGTIKWIDKQRLSRPMVQLTDGSFLELSKSNDLFIEQIL